MIYLIAFLLVFVVVCCVISRFKMKLDSDSIYTICMFLFIIFCVGCCTSLAHHQIDADIVCKDTIKTDYE